MAFKTFISVFFIHLIKLVGAFELDKENVQRVAWEDCEMFKCATIKVPLNHLDKKSELIELKITKSLAKVQPAAKTLLLDVGSRHRNHSDILEYHGSIISKILQEKVDLIVVEFRGFHQITCPKLPYNLGKSPSEYTGLYVLSMSLKCFLKHFDSLRNLWYISPHSCTTFPSWPFFSVGISITL